MITENQLPKKGWFQFCKGCEKVTSKFIPKKHCPFNKTLDNSDKIYICFECQKNKKLVKDIFININ